MLNVGPLELVVVLAIALIVVGPERLPELARSVGRALRQFRDVQDEVRDMVSAGMDDEMREAASELRRATSGVRRATDVKGAVRRAQQSVRDEVGTTRPRSSRSSATADRSTDAPTPTATPADVEPPSPAVESATEADPQEGATTAEPAGRVEPQEPTVEPDDPTRT